MKKHCMRVRERNAVVVEKALLSKVFYVRVPLVKEKV
jgi:hypothetical protein